MFSKSAERERLLKEFKRSLTWMNVNFERLTGADRAAFETLAEQLDRAFARSNQMPRAEGRAGQG